MHLYSLANLSLKLFYFEGSVLNFNFERNKSKIIVSTTLYQKSNLIIKDVTSQ